MKYFLALNVGFLALNVSFLAINVGFLAINGNLLATNITQGVQSLQETSLRRSMGRALHNLFEFLTKYNLDRCKTRDDVKENDIVICLSGKKGSKPKNVISIGKVIHVGPTPLADGHEDGNVGHVFVLDFKKARHKKDRPFNGA